MTAETARAFEALEAQAQTLMRVFIGAGYEAVSPAIIQPAGVLLDTIGERLRARTYVFTDADGEELCLRPDITVPTCRLHLERDPSGQTPARYCYNGVAFRFQAMGGDAVHPREFHQAGIETFGAADRDQADALTVKTVLDALSAAGLANAALRLGDLGLFRALLAAAPIPERWRGRLAARIARPRAFRAELQRLTREGAARRPGMAADLVGQLGPDTSDEDAEHIVGAYLDEVGIEMIGVRSLSEVSRSLLAAARDAEAAPLEPPMARLLEDYLALEAPAVEATARVAKLVRSHGIELSPALNTYTRRLKLLADLGLAVDEFKFSAELGRGLEYYTGFVFEVVSPALGRDSPVAGGGRYDSLLRSVGAPEDGPAVGAAIHTERLLAAVGLERA